MTYSKEYSPLDNPTITEGPIEVALYLPILTNDFRDIELKEQNRGTGVINADYDGLYGVRCENGTLDETLKAGERGLLTP